MNPHKNRIIHYDKSTLKLIGEIVFSESRWENVKLVQLFSKTIINILRRFENTSKIDPSEYQFSTGFNEAIAPREGKITRNTDFHSIKDGNFILSGPIFYVSSPFYQTPKRICNTHRAYEVIDYSLIDEDFIPRTNYKLLSKSLKKSEYDWINSWKIVFPKMQNNPGERTLQCSIMPPGSSHIDSVVSLIFQNNEKNVIFCGLASTIVYDFLIKIIGKKNFREDVINTLPYPHRIVMSGYILQRVLMLNCISSNYSLLWTENFKHKFCEYDWSKKDMRLKVINTLDRNWEFDTPLRNWYERRYALIELDVIVAIELGLTLHELIAVYNLLFPVLQQNEEDTWYDQKGNIIFTCSKGLNGIGVDRSEWEMITKRVTPMQRTLKDGDTYEHTITKSELYYGKKITYYAPFDKCDRVEDYKTAWKHFEKVFAENK